VTKHHHKLNGSRFNNNSNVKPIFHRFTWNKHICHSSTCVVWTLILCALFRHECHMLIRIVFKHKCCMYICVVYTQKLCIQFLCLDNAWHLCSHNTNLWNNRFHTDLKWTHEACKFVMMHPLDKIYVWITFLSFMIYFIFWILLYVFTFYFKRLWKISM